MRYATATLPFPSPARRRGIAWAALLWLAILLFSLRALLPTGFMPDPGALRAGHFEITYCTSMGPARLAMHMGAHHQTPDAPDQTVADCPFGLAGAPTCVPAATTLLPAVAAVAWRTLAWVPPTLPPSEPVPGPPLGSRAPPALLG